MNIKYLKALILICILSSIFFVQANAQQSSGSNNISKDDAESWILLKLNLYTPKEYYVSVQKYNPLTNAAPLGYSRKNLNYSFDTYNLVIAFQIERQGKITNHKYIIPIYDINRVYESNSKLWITTNTETIASIDLSDNSKYVTTAFSTDFNTNSEIEICTRLNKALLYLKKYYKKPQSNELF